MLWNDTVETHRRTVRDRALDAAAALVAEHGLTSVTMSAIAIRTGIGRATLYRYFPDIDAILTAWHERQVGDHLTRLAEIADRAGNPSDRLEQVLQAYASHSRHHESTDLAASLHRSDHMVHAQQRLQTFIRDLIAEGVRAGVLRDDIAPDELASFCLHALAGADGLPSGAAVTRLVGITLDGLRPQTATPRQAAAAPKTRA